MGALKAVDAKKSVVEVKTSHIFEFPYIWILKIVFQETDSISTGNTGKTNDLQWWFSDFFLPCALLNIIEDILKYFWGPQRAFLMWAMSVDICNIRQ